MNVTLAIYITLSAIALVAIGQILIWKLVITRTDTVGDDVTDAPGWVPEPVDALMAYQALEFAQILSEQPLRSQEPALSDESERAAERVLVGV